MLAADVDGAAAAATARAIGDGAWGFEMDVRDAGSHCAAVTSAAERGRLDVWVNNAGVMRTVKTWEHSDDDVRLMLDVNLLGVIWGSRAAVDAMRAAPGGHKHIPNMGSISALAPVPGLTVYGATKHGVLGFSTVALLESGRLLEVIPRSRGRQARLLALFPRAALRSAAVLQRVGERRRAREGQP